MWLKHIDFRMVFIGYNNALIYYALKYSHDMSKIREFFMSILETSHIYCFSVLLPTLGYKIKRFKVQQSFRLSSKVLLLAIEDKNSFENLEI